jgi:hypothetical protein
MEKVEIFSNNASQRGASCSAFHQCRCWIWKNPKKFEIVLDGTPSE